MSSCRTCLKTPAEKDISELEKGVDEDNKNCLDIMLFCLDIKVAQDSQITTNLCINCYRKIISFYKFKTLSLKNDAYLKSLDPVVQLVGLKLSEYEEEIEIKHENIFDSDGYGLSLVEDIEDCNKEIKVETEFENTGALGNIEPEEEPLSEVQTVKYEYIEEEVKENATIQKKRELRKKACGPRKKESGSRKKEQGPTKNDNGPRKKKRGPRKAKSGNVTQERQMCEECGESVLNLKEHSLRHQPIDKRPMLQCKACPKLFLSKGGRNKHYKVSHLGLKKKCDICNKEVACLSVHKLHVHNREALRFGCVSCERRYVSQSALDFHMTTHTKLRPFECDTCHMKFRCKSRLSRHIRGVHDKEKKYQCHICPKAFFRKMRLTTHVRSHTNERPYKCEECGKAFMDKYTLTNHLLLHSDVKKYSCSFCDMTFQRIGYLNNHMVSHTKEKRHPCQYCGVRFGRSDHRRRHEFTAHQKYFTKDSPKHKKRCPKKVKQLEDIKEEKQVCEECGKSVCDLKAHSLQHRPREQRRVLRCKACPKVFISIGGRRKHYRSKHLDIKSKCDICNKGAVPAGAPAAGARAAGCAGCARRFLSRAALQLHVTLHTKDFPFECDVCHKRFRSKQNISNHIRQVHEREKSHQCHFCSKAFFKKDALLRHLRSHTNERPYSCDECGKAFSDRKTLKNHLLVHGGVKSFRCHLCEMTFMRPGYLKSHMISHTKEKRHPCQYCGVRFGRSDHRRRHEFTAHQKHLAND